MKSYISLTTYTFKIAKILSIITKSWPKSLKQKLTKNKNTKSYSKG